MSSAGPKQSKSLDLVFGRTKAAYKYKRGQDVLAIVYEQVFGNLVERLVLTVVRLSRKVSFHLSTCVSRTAARVRTSRTVIVLSSLQVCGAPKGHLSSYAFALMVIYFLLLGSKVLAVQPGQSSWKISDAMTLLSNRQANRSTLCHALFACGQLYWPGLWVESWFLQLESWS